MDVTWLYNANKPKSLTLGFKLDSRVLSIVKLPYQKNLCKIIQNLYLSRAQSESEAVVEPFGVQKWFQCVFFTSRLHFYC